MAQTWPWPGSPGPLSDLQELFGDFFEDLMQGMPVGEGRFPPAELRRTEDGYRVVVAIPGVRRSDLELSIDGGTVVVEGERRPPELAEGAEPVRRERGSGRFRRTLKLDERIDAERASARVENGLLTIDLPRPAEQAPREITIEVGEGT